MNTGATTNRAKVLFDFARQQLSIKHLNGNISLCEEKDSNSSSSSNSRIEELPALIQQANAIDKAKLELPNPGLYENIQAEFKRVLTPDIFDGCRMEIHKPLNQTFAISHTFWLGSQYIPGGFYQFGANTVLGLPTESNNAVTDPSTNNNTTEQPPIVEPPTVLISRITPDGTLDGRIHQKILKNLTMRLQSQVKPKFEESQAVIDLDYKGKDYYTTFKLAPGLLLGVSYLQSITPKLMMGGEGYYHTDHQKSVLAGSSKYTTDQWSSYGSITSAGLLQLQYLRKLNERTKLATELVINKPQMESSFVAGAEYTLHQTRFNTTIDSKGRICTLIETKISPMMTFSICAEGMPVRSEFRFGTGLTIGQ